jgi:hypothetical protein
MYRRFHNRFGTAGVIIAVVALVAALSGTALAASGALTGKQKKEVEKIAKKYAGKPGAPGAAGANGSNGANGKDGTNGSNGAAGKSVEVEKILVNKPACNQLGGASVKVQGAAQGVEVCNGEKGAQGEEGEPWSPNNTLPVGATETGAWVFHVNESDEVEVYAPLSFPVQLAAALTAGHVHYESEANFTDFDGAGGQEIGCKGTTAGPTAPSGNLCVYGQGNVSNATFEAIWNLSVGAKGTTSKTGALLVFDRGATGEAFGSGSFAVTG